PPLCRRLRGRTRAGETSAAVRNVRLLIAFAACRQTLFPIPVITLFWRHELGMSLADVRLLQAIFALAATVCEVPSGDVGGRIAYRGSLLFVGVALVCWLDPLRARPAASPARWSRNWRSGRRSRSPRARTARSSGWRSSGPAAPASTPAGRAGFKRRHRPRSRCRRYAAAIFTRLRPPRLAFV